MLLMKKILFDTENNKNDILLLIQNFNEIKPKIFLKESL